MQDPDSFSLAMERSIPVLTACHDLASTIRCRTYLLSSDKGVAYFLFLTKVGCITCHQEMR